MTQQELIEKFISLSEGKLTTHEWMNWFTDHKDTVEKICGRTAFLKIKPKESFSAIRNVYIGQLGAFDWLQSVKIDTTFSELYKKDWEKNLTISAKPKSKKKSNFSKTLKTNSAI